MTEGGERGVGREARKEKIIFIYLFFLESHGKQHGGRKGEQINPLTANAMHHQVLGVRILQFNGQDQIVRSGNCCCSSIRVASVDENKNSHRKITMIHTQTTCPNRIALRAGKKGVRLAEVGALASVFEKSATELKQTLLKCKRAIQIATFNVRTLNWIGQLPQLIASAIDHYIDIICIQEHRYTRREDIKYHDTGNGWMLATASAWKNSINATIGGVCMLMGPRALKSLNNIELGKHCRNFFLSSL